MNMLSLQTHVLTSFLYALLEITSRLSAGPRAEFIYKLMKKDRAAVIAGIRASLDNGFMMQCNYIDQYVEIVGILVATACSIMIRARYSQDLNLDIIGASFFIQLSIEYVGDMMYSMWEAGVLGFRKRAALWWTHQKNHHFLRHSFIAVIATPLMTGLWIQSAVLGVPASG